MATGDVYAEIEWNNGALYRNIFIESDDWEQYHAEDDQSSRLGEWDFDPGFSWDNAPDACVGLLESWGQSDHHSGVFYSTEGSDITRIKIWRA